MVFLLQWPKLRQISWIIICLILKLVRRIKKKVLYTYES